MIAHRLKLISHCLMSIVCLKMCLEKGGCQSTAACTCALLSGYQVPYSVYIHYSYIDNEQITLSLQKMINFPSQWKDMEWPDFLIFP